ncbi:hypothetical protein KI387_022309, partial [Taxus chinensis]
FSSQSMYQNALQDTPFHIEEATIPQIQSAFKAGRLNSTGLVQFYLRHIQELNPQLSAVIEVNPDALLLAKKADAERLKAGGLLIGGLHGIPVLLKDNIASKDKLNTTAGSFALLGSKVPRDAGVVWKLRKAGAIILGKASLSEWAHFRSFSVPSGWSARSGQTKLNLSTDVKLCRIHMLLQLIHTGSAVGVSTNMVAVSLGTETDGSILCPSSFNSVVGIKPTVGLTNAFLGTLFYLEIAGLLQLDKSFNSNLQPIESSNKNNVNAARLIKFNVRATTAFVESFEPESRGSSRWR